MRPLKRLTLVLGILAVVLVLMCLPRGPAVKEVTWMGQTDEEMLALARTDITDALLTHAKILKVTIVSPGGPIFDALEIARLVRSTSDTTGLIIEIHANTLCASGCTLVLAAGTPGHRYINSLTLFLVHSMQKSGEDGKMKCVSFVPDPKTQQDRAIDVLLIIMRDTYVKYTHIDKDTMSQYLTCGNEQIGKGEIAVKLGFADKVD